jgi:6-phosphofructokinase 1
VYNKIIGENDYVMNDIVYKKKKDCKAEAWVRAGPREFTHFDPSKVVAAIVTCGGLCPGLNNVIREIVHSLYCLYGVKKIMGIKYAV